MGSQTILQKIEVLYPTYNSLELENKITTVLNNFKEKRGPLSLNTDLSEKDCFLITYGDSIYEKGTKPLESLSDILNKKVKGLIPNIHILPFYPYSSDDGFSVIDYFKVNPGFGNWDNVRSLSKNYNLMFDGVINHISAKSDWFISYLNGDKEYSDFFTEVDPQEDLRNVTRPRALPLLTKVDTKNGIKYVWTTFSEDQVDLNYKNPELFIRILELILFYIDNGASYLRLDAIGFLWKTIGTNCIHLPETHLAIQLYRQLIEEVVDGFVFITETNVPHKDNISYFGNGFNEASMVYQFPLPPLILNAIQTENCSYLCSWADTLSTPSIKTSFFNFLASHDGIGLNPIRGIIPENEIIEMTEKVKESGGLVSYKKNPDGSQSPYELNISLYNALSKPDDCEKTMVKKFILAHSIQCGLVGIPAIYIHSLFGSENYYDGVKQTGRNRSINREKLEKKSLEQDLEDKNSRRSLIYTGLKDLIEVRTSEKSFHPNGEQEVLTVSNSVFVIKRTSPDKREEILTIFNISSKKESLSEDYFKSNFINIFTGEHCNGVSEIEPHSFLWLKMGISK